MEPILKLNDLVTQFFTPEGTVNAVNKVSFELTKGETLGILGESGCGKSVTAMSIMRLIPNPPGKIMSGSISFLHHNLLELSPQKMHTIRGNRISMIFQEPMTSLNPVFTIGDQISEMYRTHKKCIKSEAMEQTLALLHLVGISAAKARVKEYPHQLSGGMRQRIMIAMALACGPDILIADEPTTALDVTIQAQILDLMLDLQEKIGMAIIMITHDLGVIAEVSDKVVVMYAGQIVEYGSVNALFSDAQHPYTKGLLQSIPQLGQKFKVGKQPLKEISGLVPNLIHLPTGCFFAPRCTYSQPRCTREAPPLFHLSQNQGSRCWLVEKI